MTTKAYTKTSGLKELKWDFPALNIVSTAKHGSGSIIMESVTASGIGGPSWEANIGR